MTHSEFGRIIEHRIQKIRDILQQKQKEYATDDTFHNFKEKVLANEKETPEQVLWGYMRKHLSSIKDMVDGIKPPMPELVNEKIGDAINYLILLEGLFYERIGKG